MDQGIALVLAIVALVAGGAAMWAVLRKRLRPEVVALISATVAEIMQQVSGVLDEQMVRELAGAIWDSFAAGSRYVSREAFVDLVWRAVQDAVPVRRQLVAQRAARPA